MIRKRSPGLVLSTISGLILLGQGTLFMAGIFVGLPETDETLDQLRAEMGEAGFRTFQIRNAVAGLSTGAAILILSFLLHRRPDESRRWGIMIIILALMSMAGAGFLNIAILPGVVLGVIGGALAIRSVSAAPAFEKPAPSKEEIAKKEAGPEVPAGPIAYVCSTCNIEFRSDEELRTHVIRNHMRR